MTADDHPLETRTRLPDALRVLLDEYPREAWEADPNFSALIRFWLDRHMMFRRILERLTTDNARYLDRQIDARVYATHLARLGSQFLNELHGHHMIEDTHYFPHLKGLDDRLGRGFEVLDRDHHAIDGHLATFAAAANDVIGLVAAGGPDRDQAAHMGRVLADTERFLDRHLIDEEDLVVPVLLKFAPAGMA